METPTTNKPVLSRWDQWALEALFAAIAIGAIVVAVVLGLDIATADELGRRVDITDDAGSVDPERADGFRLDVRSATLVLEDPSASERLGTMLPTLFAAGTVGGAAAVLWQVTRSTREGDPFHRDNATRLRRSAVIVLVGGLAAAAAEILVTLWLVDRAHDELPVKLGATGTLLALPVSFVLYALAEIFRRGAAMREELEGLV